MCRAMMATAQVRDFLHSPLKGFCVIILPLQYYVDEHDLSEKYEKFSLYKILYMTEILTIDLAWYSLFVKKNPNPKSKIFLFGSHFHSHIFLHF